MGIPKATVLNNCDLNIDHKNRDYDVGHHEKFTFVSCLHYQTIIGVYKIWNSTGCTMTLEDFNSKNFED